MKGSLYQSLSGFARLGLVGFLAVVFAAGSILWSARAGSSQPAAIVAAVPVASPVSPGPSPAPVPTAAPLPESFSLPPAKWIGQTYNNCGPATVSELLQYFGHDIDQNVTKAALRSGPDDKNVTLAEISAYLRADFQLESKVLVNGNIVILKRLLAAGVPVIVENWLHPNEDIGHVLLLRGYDDRRGVLIGDDVYLGPGHLYPYAEFDQAQWQPFNRIFLPVYRPETEPAVRSIVGADWNEAAMYQRALAAAQLETQTLPGNPYSWLNLGADALALGQNDQARAAFERSRSLGWPGRLLWYRTEPLVFFGPDNTLE
jgi:hypothetical protein